MKNFKAVSKTVRRFYGANSFDAFNPEIWSKFGLAILVENMIMSNLIHTEYKPEIANEGDTINTRRPSTAEATRKAAGSDITVQDMSATNVAIQLNHHAHSSFGVYDIERAYSMVDLVTTYIEPHAQAMARYLDKAVIAQMYGFMDTSVAGALGAMTTSNAIDKIVDTKTQLDINKAYEDNRRMMLGTTTQGTILKNTNFLNANFVGDGGTAFQRAQLGSKLGFDMFMGQNMPDVAVGNTTGVGAINLTAGYLAGATSIVVDGAGSTTTNVAIGSWFSLNGYPYQVATVTGSPTVTAVTFTPALRVAAADDAVITWYKPGAVNFGAGYAAGYVGDLVIDGFTVAPKAGQLVTIGTYGGPRYMVISASTTTLRLDRPLDAAVVDDAVVGIGPAGAYNFGFHKNAIALITRPLPPVPEGAGARSSVSTFNNIGLRATVGYSITQQRTIVTLDVLAGIKILDTNLGCVMLA